MIPKQDRQGVRRATDLEQKYDLGRDYTSIIQLATNAQKAAQQAINAVSSINAQIIKLTNAAEKTAEDIADIFVRLEALEGGSGLPDGYTLLEYIESSGTQYVDTGFMPNQDTRIIAEVSDWETTDISTSVYGSRISAGAADSFMLLVSGAGAYRSDYSNSAISLDTSISFSEKIAIDQNKNVVTIGGETLTHATKTFSCTNNLFVCGTNTGGALSHGLKGKLYSCQIYDNGTLVRDYLPCINPSGEVGLYDLVNDVFYGNAGTGEFVAGDALYDESDITKLEYIESSGTQYVDTGFMPNQDTKVVMDANLLTEDNSSNTFFGARTTSGSNAYGVLWYKANSAFRFFYNDGFTEIEASTYTGRKTVSVDKNTITIDSSVTRTYADFQCEYNMFLCAMNNAGTAAFQADLRIYSCQIYDNDTLIRDYIPGINPSGEYGLYDKVSKKFYSDAAGGSFTGA